MFVESHYNACQVTVMHEVGPSPRDQHIFDKIILIKTTIDGNNVGVCNVSSWQIETCSLTIEFEPFRLTK
jgi:hypothetical protein